MKMVAVSEKHLLLLSFLISLCIWYYVNIEPGDKKDGINVEKTKEEERFGCKKSSEEEEQRGK